jgi:DNA-binding transcriptional ArsR family regulator
MATVQVIQSASAAERLLKPERLQLLELLENPDSAAGLARQLKMPRQTVNYHLRELEKAGLVEFVASRPKGNCTERIFRATARSYVISPSALGKLGLTPAEARDRFSAAYLVAVAARTVREVAALRQGADQARKDLATLTLESEIRFRSPAARKEFTEELLHLIAGLVARFHDGAAEPGRSFRLVTAAYPTPTNQEPLDQASVLME